MKVSFKELKKVMRRLEAVMNGWSRLVVAHPDLCIFSRSYPIWGLRYLRKKGERRGFYMASLGWLTFSVRI